MSRGSRAKKCSPKLVVDEPRVQPRARLDLFAAQDHYEGEREGVGLEFIAEMEQIAHKIAARPLRFPAIGDAGARRALGKRFPYFLAFFVLEDRVRIVAVMHQHQHPDTWKARS